MAINTQGQKYWALIVAAGTGSRMGSDTPKQYLPLAGRLVIEHSLDCFACAAAIAGLAVVIRSDDANWAALNYQSPKPLMTTTGGAERCDSVLAGLLVLTDAFKAADEDWVLVHDAARACLCSEELTRLIDEVGDDPVGGLLGLPARDTLKSAAEGRVAATLDRRLVWLAQTPQMFRLGLLRESLEAALNKGLSVTDESMAMELAGHHPRLVEGRASNIKLTTAEDLLQAESILKQRRED